MIDSCCFPFTLRGNQGIRKDISRRERSFTTNVACLYQQDALAVQLFLRGEQIAFTAELMQLLGTIQL